MSYQHLTLEERYCLAEFRGKRAEYSSDRTNAQAVAVNDQPGVEEESREERVSSLWGIQQGEAPKADAAQTAEGI